MEKKKRESISRDVLRFMSGFPEIRRGEWRETDFYSKRVRTSIKCLEERGYIELRQTEEKVYYRITKGGREYLGESC
jgi:DNA-binding PadR family transcriptional regulator